MPDAVVGDLDSLEPDLLRRLPRVVRLDDQDTTDVDKLLRYVAGQGWGTVTLIGVEGDRLDHVLSSLGSGVACGLEVRVVLRTQFAHVLRPGRRVFAPKPGRLVSLIPYPSCRASLSGVRWPLREADLSLGGAISVSNRAVEATVTVRLDAGTALLFLERMPEEEPEW